MYIYIWIYTCVYICICIYVLFAARCKGNMVGIQGLERAEGAKESQGHKDLGIQRPCLGPVRAQGRDLLSFTLGQQGFGINPRAEREHF